MLTDQVVSCRMSTPASVKWARRRRTSWGGVAIPCGMETSRSPRDALRFAYRLGRRVLPDQSWRWPRRDFTLPQLFACLVLRECYGLS